MANRKRVFQLEFRQRNPDFSTELPTRRKQQARKTTHHLLQSYTSQSVTSSAMVHTKSNQHSPDFIQEKVVPTIKHNELELDK